MSKINKLKMSKDETQDAYKAFAGMNFSAVRDENEPYTEYKERLKQNRDMLNLYNKVGRDMFRMMFPAGVLEAMKTIKQSPQK